jgi:hypothetical protein
VLRSTITFLQFFINREMGALFEALPAAPAESRSKGVYLALIILALHIVLVLFHWIGDFYVTLNLFLSGGPHKST